MKKSIGIIGTGKLGVELGIEIIKANFCDNIVLWNRSIRPLESVLLSMRVFASINNRCTKVNKLKWNSIQKLDAVIIVVKDDYDPRDLLGSETFPNWFPVDVRTVGFKRDIPQVKQVCWKLRRYKGIVFVITNPLDIMTTIISKWLPDASVFGLGSSLDAARLAYILAENGILNDGYKDCHVGGEHGRNIVLFRSLWSGKLSDKYLKTSDLEKALHESSLIGPKIVKGLGYTLHDCAAVFSNDIAYLLGVEEKKAIVCASTDTGGEISIGQPLALSKGGKIEIVKLTKSEKSEVEDSRQAVGNLINKMRRSRAFPEIN